eukprot:jgi/Hompol1/6102/HPOL_000362-RA
MPAIHRVLTQQPAHALLLRGIADPPTTTLQRLMALMTGALPTLVDAGSNFASTAIAEDNLVAQLQRYGRATVRPDQRVISLGDDTWEGLFPTLLNESHSYPSFDVWDLHTVDAAVISHLYPMLAKPVHDWGLLIAHFLGVDHAGHRYGPGHPAMGDKLIQMNMVLEHIFDAVHEDTLVVVIGDHGMDAKGDHGGDSDNEVDAALFFYSKQRPLMLVDSDSQHIMQQIVDGIEKFDFGSMERELHHPFAKWMEHRTACQIDLVSTLAMLMGLPIPYGSLGTAIPELFLFANQGDDVDDALQNLVAVSRINALQLHSYIDKYSSMRSDAATAFAESLSIFEEAEQAFARLPFAQQGKPATHYGNDNATEQQQQSRKDMIACYLAYVKYNRMTLLIARRIWSRFEPTLMIFGDSLLVACPVLVMIYFVAFQFKPIEAPHGSWVVGGAVIGIALGSLRPIVSTVYAGVSESNILIHTGHEMLFFGTI